jgi:hypothetical protein
LLLKKILLVPFVAAFLVVWRLAQIFEASAHRLGNMLSRRRIPTKPLGRPKRTNLEREKTRVALRTALPPFSSAPSVFGARRLGSRSRDVEFPCRKTSSRRTF